MTAFYNFVSGPLAWAAWAVFILGSVYRLVTMLRLAKAKDGSSLAYMDWKFSLRSILHWAVPFGSLGWRENPAVTVLTFVFHLCFFGIAIFLSSHVVLWDYAFGIDFWSLPDPVADIMTLTVLGICIFFAYRRLFTPAVRFITRPGDWLALALVALPFLTGFMATHMVGDNLIMSTLHVLSGEAVLVAIPFTRLSHALLTLFTRAYMGSEFGGVRHCRDW
ncbi:TmcC family electron transfer complex membrane anchor subunit [Oleidesulfovibrio sp.]|uniref:TmcC family electron transfer complex membrane anchor subunit n=1 Tax=Oleidesulfovibrio sp. TaxID=2909707 RepID=UPI003A8A18A3